MDQVWGLQRAAMQLVFEGVHVTDFVFLVISTFSAAAAGAWAAQAVMMKREDRRELTLELNALGTAMVLTAGIFNAALSIKRQHLVRLLKAFREDQKRIPLELTKARESNAPAVVEVAADFEFLDPSRLPIEQVQNILLERISLRGRGLAAGMQLGVSIASFNSALETRNELIRDQIARDRRGLELVEFYLGTRSAAGHTDARYSSALEAIELYGNDVIFYSKQLAEDLQTYGRLMQRRYRLIVRKAPPAIPTMDFSPAEQEGLIPPREEYAAWLKGFQMRRSPSRVVVDWLLGRRPKAY